MIAAHILYRNIPLSLPLLLLFTRPHALCEHASGALSVTKFGAESSEFDDLAVELNVAVKFGSRSSLVSSSQ